MADAAYSVGFDFGEDLKEELKLGSNIEDVAVAMDLEHRVFGMKARVAEKGDLRIVIIAESALGRCTLLSN